MIIFWKKTLGIANTIASTIIKWQYINDWVIKICWKWASRVLVAVKQGTDNNPNTYDNSNTESSSCWDSAIIIFLSLHAWVCKSVFLSACVKNVPFLTMSTYKTARSSFLAILAILLEWWQCWSLGSPLWFRLTYQQPLERLPWKLLQTVMVFRGWNLLTEVILLL